MPTSNDAPTGPNSRIPAIQKAETKVEAIAAKAVDEAAPAVLAAGGKIEGAIDVAKDEVAKAVTKLHQEVNADAIAKGEQAVERIAEEVWGERKVVAEATSATAHVLVGDARKTFTFVGEHADHLAKLLAGHGSFSGVLQAARAWLGVRSHEVMVGVIALLAVLIAARAAVAHEHRIHHPGQATHGADLLSADGQTVIAHVDGVSSCLRISGSRYTLMRVDGTQALVWEGPVRLLKP